MTARRWMTAAVVAAAAVMLASGCSSATSGSAERGESVGAAADSSAASSDSTAPSMTPSSGDALTATDADPAPESAEGADDSAAPSWMSSETPTAATETTSQETADACPDTASWTTDDEETDLAGNAPILDLSADATDCFDRFVITLGPDAYEPGYRIRYVDSVFEDGSGMLVELAGDASLEVIVDSPAYDPETGRGTLQIPDHDNVVDVSGFGSLWQVAYAGSFEGRTTFGIGVADELPFAATTGTDVDGNATLTVAIAHE